MYSIVRYELVLGKHARAAHQLRDFATWLGEGGEMALKVIIGLQGLARHLWCSAHSRGLESTGISRTLAWIASLTSASGSRGQPCRAHFRNHRGHRPGRSGRPAGIRTGGHHTVLCSEDLIRVFEQFTALDLASRSRAENMAGGGTFRSLCRSCFRSAPGAETSFDLADVERHVIAHGENRAAGLPMALAMLGGRLQRVASQFDLHRRPLGHHGPPRSRRPSCPHGAVALVR